MAKIDMEQALWQDVLQAIKESNINYGKDYDIYTYYHYDNGNIVGVVYGWFYDRCLYIDIVFVSAEYRGKGIATSMLKKVIQEIKSKDIDNIVVELVQYKGKYLLANILVRLGFCLHNLYYILRQRVIYYMSLEKEY